jgi:hypothetical protein
MEPIGRCVYVTNNGNGIIFRCVKEQDHKSSGHVLERIVGSHLTLVEK